MTKHDSQSISEQSAMEMEGGAQTDSEELPDVTEQADLIDPVLEAFERAGCPLSDTLGDMLRETQEHRFDYDTYRNNRKGSGFVQATRVIGSLVSRGLAGTPEAYREIFGIVEEDEWNWKEKYIAKKIAEDPEVSFAVAAGEADEAYEAHKDADQESINIDALRREVAELPEHSQMLAQMILDSLQPVTPETYPQGVFLPRYTGDHKVGTCTTAEKYFLDAAYTTEFHRSEYMRRSRNKFNVVLGDQGDPLMLEKVDLGVDHSALTIREVVIGGVRIPPGALVYVDYPPDKQDRTINAQECAGFSLLRLTPLAVPPEDRERIFGMIMDFEKRNELPNAAGAKIEDFSAIADEIVRGDTGFFQRLLSKAIKQR